MVVEQEISLNIMIQWARYPEVWFKILIAIQLVSIMCYQTLLLDPLAWNTWIFKTDLQQTDASFSPISFSYLSRSMSIHSQNHSIYPENLSSSEQRFTGFGNIWLFANAILLKFNDEAKIDDLEETRLWFPNSLRITQVAKLNSRAGRVPS